MTIPRPIYFGVFGISLLWLVGIIAVGIAGIIVDAGSAFGRDLGQWQDSPTREWYQSLMQPDAPTASCCGEADAYWADEIHVRDGKTFATITDDREDAPLGRPHINVGTEIEIPSEKLKWDKSNPTGHSIVFLSRSLYVYCFVQGALI